MQCFLCSFFFYCGLEMEFMIWSREGTDNRFGLVNMAPGDGCWLVLDVLTVQFHAEIDVYMILAHTHMNALHFVFLNKSTVSCVRP